MRIGGLGIYIGRRRGGGVVLEDETLALIARFTTPPTEARKILINNLIIAGKDHGWWNLSDMLKIQAAHSAQAATLNWIKDANNSILVNSPSFIVDRGFYGNGLTSYVNLNFTPSTEGVKYTLNDANFGFGCLTDAIPPASANNGAYSVDDITIWWYNGDKFYCDINSGNNTAAYRLVSNTKHYIIINRTSVVNWSTFVDKTKENHSRSTTNLPSRSLYLGAYNSNGNPIFHGIELYNVVFAGASFSDVIEGLFIDDLEIYMNAIGANIL